MRHEHPLDPFGLSLSKPCPERMSAFILSLSKDGHAQRDSTRASTGSARTAWRAMELNR
jgi:hypothetical protein